MDWPLQLDNIANQPFAARVDERMLEIQVMTGGGYVPVIMLQKLYAERGDKRHEVFRALMKRTGSVEAFDRALSTVTLPESLTSKTGSPSA